MSLFGKKENKKPKDEEPDIDVVIAQEITVSPPEESGEIFIAPDFLQKLLLGKIVEKGKSYYLKDSKDKDEFFSSFGIDIESAFLPTEKLYIVDTKPLGEVKITKNTKINFLKMFPYSDGIPKAKILLVKEQPNLKKLMEVKDLEQIRKIVKAGNFINKYEDEKQVIYFAGNYFFKKKK